MSLGDYMKQVSTFIPENVSAAHLFIIFTHKSRNGSFSKCIYLDKILAAVCFFSFKQNNNNNTTLLLVSFGGKHMPIILEPSSPVCEQKVWLFFLIKYLFSSSTSWCPRCLFGLSFSLPSSVGFLSHFFPL